ncbi:glutamine-fructose-6-phosphate transaminase [Pelomyxa schiedti]|nr:glutamine-fructose-6-phosphate transaminase [Pelomyxa schiedti]
MSTTTASSSNRLALRRVAVISSHLGARSTSMNSRGIDREISLGRRNCCGISCFVGNEDCTPYLLEGLKILENRGYDSAGITTFDAERGCLVTTKYASVGSTSDALTKLRDSASSHKGHKVGIAHTRWATHGGKTDTNAHPHLDAKNRVAIVHNGVIQNSNELKEELTAKGIPFRSETDSEVIAQLIGHYIDVGMTPVEACKKTQTRLQGTWGVVVLCKDMPDKVIAMKNGSPLLVGMGKTKVFVASEPSAFARHTSQYIALQDMEVAVLGPDCPLDLSRVQVHAEDKIPLSPDPWPHWTVKEIMEQPVSLALALNFGGRIIDDMHVKLGGLESKSRDLLPIRHLVVAACGTSLFAGAFGASLMRYLSAFETVQVVDAAETCIETFPANNGGLLVISQSGETKDVHRALLLGESLNLPRFSVVNCVGSLIARTTNCGVYINAGREFAVASTKAFTTQVCCLGLIAVWFAQHRAAKTTEPKQREVIEALRRLPTSAGMALSTWPQIKDLARKIHSMNVRSMFVLGKGLSEHVAKEGALKIKEISYYHAEGYSGGALKHGPFALIEPGTPIIMLIPDDSQASFMRIAAAEVKARGAFTIIVTDNSKIATGHADEVIVIPHNGLLTSLVCVIPLQLLAYELSVLRNVNPDKPRNLAKAVTVD